MIRTEKTHLKSVARSHAGMTGKNNEDRFGVSAFLLDEQSATPVLFAVLADGIGGHRAGEVAAEMVVDIVSKVVSESDGSNPQEILRQAIQTASREVYKLAQAEDGRKGMGATVVTTWVIGKRLYTAYVGDSRIYLIREGRIYRLTRDHSWIQEALDTGILTPEQAVGHPNAHVIRRYVGSPEPPEVDFRLRLSPQETNKESVNNQGLLLKNGDRLLLCSDGLTDLVEDPEILEIIQQNSPEDAVDKLTDLANERGGHDNITTVLVRVPEGVFVESKEKPQPAGLPFRSIGIGCLSLAVVAALAVAGFFGLRWWNNRAEVTPTETLQVTEGPAFLETSPESTPSSQVSTIQTPLTSLTSSATAVQGTVAQPGDAGASDEGNIPPPPNADSMTAFPTDTAEPTLTPTATQTITATVSGTP
jgi:serine/threonine protein phosphatase PrpC